MVSTRLFILVVLGNQNVLGSNKVICSLDDSNCLTEGAKRTYRECVNGDLKGVPSSDPLYADWIEAELPVVKYTIQNATLSGMRSCTPELVKINAKDMTFDYHVACKHLVFGGLCDIKGKFGQMDIELKADIQIDFYDYVFLFDGKLEQSVDEDEKIHVSIKNYKLDINARGKVVYDYQKLYNSDGEKSAASVTAMLKFANENWKEVDKIVRQPVMEKFMSLFIKNVNAYLKVVPIEHVFVKET